MTDYRAAVAEKMGINIGHSVGAFSLIDAPLFGLECAVSLRLALVDTKLRECFTELEQAQEYLKEAPYDNEYRDDYKQLAYLWRWNVRDHYFLPYARYVYSVKNAKSLRSEYSGVSDKSMEGTYEEVRTRLVIKRFLATHDGALHTPDPNGWKLYLERVSPDFYNFLKKTNLETRLPDERLLNAYIVAQSQSGKSELLKLLAYSIITQGKEALVFIEPGGDVSRQIAEWKECGDRLIYVDLSLELGMAPTVNPFEIYGIRAEDTSPAAQEVKTVIAQQLLSAFQEVLGAGEGSDFSRNMQTVLIQCLLVLLDYPGATIRDLRRFMDDRRNADLVAFAQSRHHYEDVRTFFEDSYVGAAHIKPTKEAIRTKLQVLFSSGKFAKLTCGASTFMLEKAIEERKIIVFNLAEGSVGEQEGSAFGRLMVAMLQGIAVRRLKQHNRVPTRVIIDEAQNYTTKSMEKIVTQAAKFKLFLTLAQQQIGQGMTTEMRSAALNMSAQIAGRSAPALHSTMASMVNVERGEIESLKERENLSSAPPASKRLNSASINTCSDGRTA